MLARLLTITGLTIAFGCAQPARTVPETTTDLVVATFNIRYGAANERDGRDLWRNRRPHVLETIADWQADVIGIQEALHQQVEYLHQHLPRFRFLGQGRDGGTRGEYASILFDPERLELLDHGDFWLSETPDEVASVGWDAALTRMVTWAEFRDRANDCRFRVWNTHFDHRGTVARTRSGELLGARTADSALPDIVLGDLNAGENSPALEALRGAGLRDTFRDRFPEAEGVGTFGAWVGRTDGEKIDYVLTDGGFVTVSAAIDRRTFDGRNPSDHFPVVTTLRFAERD